ncbi:excalibur calcium-binding domain-containing protein [Salinibacterium sp. SWN139]|uniref:excalibur calcium-binding domain-containing protein n=1 Tax=Salinibacterium sp. SWN139 TaxID=2792055 RepID=UPI0018CE16C0|nr:excalibur calcium-binding domain-containing protein [Salinibacterium sp. SWN139]MBH0053652.1 excalibur calcium-binding domain-containing protein [Salinibacterium sp. SWN139]
MSWLRLLINQPPKAPQAPAGWYDDGSGKNRWWDGTQWSNEFAPKDAPVPHRAPEWFKPTLSTWIVGAFLVLFAYLTLVSAGVAAVLVLAAFFGLFTGLYVLISGRRSWASVPSRKAGAIVIAASLFATIVGGTVGAGNAPVDVVANAEQVTETAAPSPSPTPSATRTASPSATFSVDAPADPDKATAPASDAAVSILDTSFTDTTALALLATLPIKGKAPKTGYARTAKFGAAWLDVDRNGCDTRNDILARDLSALTKSGSCKVLTGTLVSPFTNTSIDFLRGNTTSALVQIDHVVSLSNAWQTGAQQLTQEQRITLANDPINLLAVDGKSNAQKGAGDAATWLPSNKSFRCNYVAAQVSVKATYGLWVTTAEHDAIERVLDSCPDQRALTSSFTPAPAPEPEPVVAAPVPAPVTAPAPAPAPAYAHYANCTAVRAAGAAPLYAGQPGYETPRLDRDGDGIACE